MKKHINSAVCFVFNKDEQLLLLRRHPRDPGGGMWGPPGGRVDEGEDAKTTVIRETLEETGLRLNKVTLLGVQEVVMPHAVVTLTTFAVHIPSDSSIAINPEEHTAYKWFDLKLILDESSLLWGVPTSLRDFGYISDLEHDPTLSDGSGTTVKLISTN